MQQRRCFAEALSPQGQLFAGAMQHPLSGWGQQTGPRRQLQALLVRQGSVVRAVPVQQRVNCRDRAVSYSHQWLVVQVDLAAFPCTRHRGRQPAPGAMDGITVRVKQFPLALAATFGAVQGSLRRAE